MPKVRRRADDAGRSAWRVLLRENWYRDLWLLAITLVVTFTAVKTLGLVQKVANESTERRHQTCTLFEKQEKAAADRLVATYAYLGSLRGGQLEDPLNRAVIASLPDVEREARASVAPAFCNAKGVGLAEPKNPLPLPERPSTLPVGAFIFNTLP
jgi:hypothetical protein